MITENRKAELVAEFAMYMERYLDKQWIDDEARQNVAENAEELEFLRTQVSYQILTQY